MYAIKTKNLTKRYGSKTVVDHIDLNVTKGNIFGFLGKNGAGKSTLINMITGLIQPTSGSFSLLNENPNNRQLKHEKMGVLPEYGTFYEDMSALTHLKYFSNIMGLSLTKADLINTLRLVGLEKDVNLKTKKFSFGMKKKLGIAQAIINKPDILFLDEPTSGVDPNAVLNIHSLIKRIAAEGTTIFLTSHNLDEVEKICDDIAIMQNGRVSIQGNMEQLRNQHQNNLTVCVTHNQLKSQEEECLKQSLKPLTSDMRCGAKNTEITVKSEAIIPHINRTLVELNIDIYSLEVDKPSLEEIFLNI